MFAPFAIDLSKRQLWHGRQSVPLTAKTFDVLVFLVANRDRVITKDEFFSHVWPDSIVLEANLVRQISLIRRALGKGRDDHDFIVTLPGRGYQFVADVTELGALPIDPLPDSVADATAPGPTVDPTPDEPEAELPLGGDAVVTDAVAERRRYVPRGAKIKIAGIAAAVALTVWAGSWPLGQHENDQSGPGLRKFTFDSAFPREPTWSPNGRTLAYTSDRSGNADIWVQSLSDPTPVQLTTDGARDWQPHWSPVGDQIVFRSERDGGGIFLVSAAGGTPKRLTNFGYRPRWSLNGKLILFSGSTVRTGARSVYVTNSEGGPPREVAVDWMKKLRDGPRANSVHFGWDPDGEHVSLWGRFGEATFSFLTVSLADGSAQVSDVSAEVRSQLLGQDLSLGDFVWSPSGRSIYFEGTQGDARSLWRIDVDPKTRRWIAGPERLSLGTTDSVNIALSPDGTRIAFTSQTAQTRVWLQPFDSASGKLTGPAQPITPGNTQDRDVDVSEDGQQLAYRTQRGQSEEIWAYSLPDHSERLLLASTTARRTSPLWSPDGRQLLYARRTPGTGASVVHSLALLPSAGGAERTISLPNKMGIDPRDWARDGRTIVGQCQDASMSTVGTCLVSLAPDDQATEVKVLAYSPGLSLFCQRFSPDQRWVSFLALNPESLSLSRVYMVPVEGGQWIPITDGLAYEDKPRWAPDGRTLYFVSSRSGSLNVWGRHIDPTAGKPIGEAFPVTSYATSRIGLSSELGQMEIALSRDALFLPMTERSGDIWLLEGLHP